MSRCACGCGIELNPGRTWAKGHNARHVGPRWREEDRGYESPCWIWLLSYYSEGYGQSKWKGRPANAHRAVYQEFVGEIPADQHLDHLCRVRACVNPAHMEPVTPRENILRGTGMSARNAVKTHCPHGHAYTEDNIYRRVDGARTCRECTKAAARERYWRQKEAA